MRLSALAATLAIAVASVQGQAYDGVATWYEQKGNAGSCGAYRSDGDFIVAMSPAHGHNAHCGRTVTIKNVGGGINNHGIGKSITATVADTCPAAECSPEHLDLSTGAFSALTGGKLDPPGKIAIHWYFN